MEFKKREVKKPKQFRPRTVEPKTNAIVDGSTKKLQPPPTMTATMENRILIVSISSEIYEIGDLNEVDILSPYPSMNRTYDQNRRLRHFEYALPANGSMMMREIVDYWNIQAIEKKFNKPKFSVRSVPEKQKEGVS